VICGPTATGKSEVALAVAEALGGEIVNADSRQIYSGMDVGTGTPPLAMRSRVAHHLYAFLDPAERYSASRYVEDATAIIRDISRKGRLPIIVGGTGFYIEALLGTMPLDRPPPDDALRERVRREAKIHEPEWLWEWLRLRAPEIAADTKRGDGYRIVRGLERALARELAVVLSESSVPVAAAIVRLSANRDVLLKRIKGRVKKMFETAIVSEAVAVRAASPNSLALSGLGYAEALSLWDGLANEDDAVARTVTRTMQYAKRQETWFRRLKDVAVVDTLDVSVAAAAVVAYATERFGHNVTQ